ncbi:probable RNA 3'-terminal phosphate cyclase-like protein [Cimex lectularius]|uniref:RNA 3'-terminal phosphate cyclase-like protein n=1 Tax=Cimex lectularius TaxID=79782 RepID=A0A8I6RN84_CIMLE|nr:probable RNA 3'-terminal phosphate cyclase-like protein [Cimex lectularius]
MVKISNFLQFEGSNFMRQRLILSVLTGKSITIKKIRSNEMEPGLREYEVNLLRLIDKMTNGTWLEVNETGTEFSFTPGSLIGGPLEHECCKLRGIGYYLEVVFALAPFCKVALSITLKGVTNNQVDPSVDAFKHGAVSVLKKFIVVDPGIEMQIKKRGMEPEGGGEIYFHCPIVKLKAIQMKDMGKVKKVRGTAYAVKVSPVLANRFIETAKGEMIRFIPNVFITSDFLKGQNGGKSPGFGGCLTAETTTGVILTAEKTTPPPPGQRQTPEDMGKTTAWLLLEEIARGGLVDSSFQSLACLFIAFGQKDVTQLVVGPLSPYTIELLRHLRKFMGLTFKLDPYVEDEDEDQGVGSNKVLITGVGIGYNRFA